MMALIRNSNTYSGKALTLMGEGGCIVQLSTWMCLCGKQNDSFQHTHTHILNPWHMTMLLCVTKGMETKFCQVNK